MGVLTKPDVCYPDLMVARIVIALRPLNGEPDAIRRVAPHRVP